MSQPDLAAGQHENDAQPGDNAELQFDQAEFVGPGLSGPACGICHRAIGDSYYEINGKILCAECRQRVEFAFRGGSPVARVLKAAAFGLAGAAAGAVLYYTIIRVTGMNIGLVAVVVGLMVGGAVRKGTGNRGGLFYQFLAVFLTYVAIGAMNMPFLIQASDEASLKQQEVRSVPGKEGKADDKTEPMAEPSSAAANDTGPSGLGLAPGPSPVERAQSPSPVSQPIPKAAAPDIDKAPDRIAADRQLRSMTPARLIILGMLVFMNPVIMAYLAPISGLIYCFALWAAWKINRPARLVFTGPFLVSAGFPKDAAPKADVDGQ
jgi:hypothetical protein